MNKMDNDAYVIREKSPSRIGIRLEEGRCQTWWDGQYKGENGVCDPDSYKDKSSLTGRFISHKTDS